MVVNIPDVSDELTEQILENAFEKAEKDSNPEEWNKPFWAFEPVGGFHRYVRCWFCGRICCVPFALANIPNRSKFGTCHTCYDEDCRVCYSGTLQKLISESEGESHEC